MNPREELRHSVWMDMAILIAKLSTCNGHKVGAILVKDNRVISMGYNGSPAGCDHCQDVGCYGDPCVRTTHAEQNAIIAGTLHGVSTVGATCYSTLQPCLDCTKSLINAGIRQIVYLESHKTDPLATTLLHQADVKMTTFQELLKEQ